MAEIRRIKSTTDDTIYDLMPNDNKKDKIEMMTNADEGASAKGSHALAIMPGAQSGLAKEDNGGNNPTQYTIALGNNAKATQNHAIAIGHDSKATGSHSIAIGWYAEAQGAGSVATGADAVAIGYNAHAEGGRADYVTKSAEDNAENGPLTEESDKKDENNNQIYHIRTTAYGPHSHAEGLGTWTKGLAAHAEGQQTKAQGSRSHAEGWITKASGDNSHAEGINTKSDKYASHAEGYGTVAGGDSTPVTSTAQEIGYYTHAEGNGTLAAGSAAHAEGWATQANGAFSHAEGKNTRAHSAYSHAEGGQTKAGFKDTETNTQPTAINNETEGYFTHAEGNGTWAKGNSSHAEGWHTQALGKASHTEGVNTTAGKQNQTNGGSHAEGVNTSATGDYAHAEGANTSASGSGSHAGGQGCSATGNFSFAHGEGLNATKKNQFVIGQYNVSSDSSLFIIGKGNSGSTPANILEVDDTDLKIDNINILTSDRLHIKPNTVFQDHVTIAGGNNDNEAKTLYVNSIQSQRSINKDPVIHFKNSIKVDTGHGKFSGGIISQKGLGLYCYSYNNYWQFAGQTSYNQQDVGEQWRNIINISETNVQVYSSPILQTGVFKRKKGIWLIAMNWGGRIGTGILNIMQQDAANNKAHEIKITFPSSLDQSYIRSTSLEYYCRFRVFLPPTNSTEGAAEYPIISWTDVFSNDGTKHTRVASCGLFSITQIAEIAIDAQQLQDYND